MMEVHVETWTKKGKHSRFLMPLEQPRDYESDEAIAAECLLLLANSGDDSWRRTSDANTDMVQLPGMKQRQLINLSIAVVPETKKQHVCSVCGKSFQSHQALGGHQTSHRAAKPQTIKVPRPISAVDPVSGTMMMMRRKHECYICKEIFSSGQSLGGHMRKHYDGVLNKPKSSTVSTDVSGTKSEVTSSVGGGAFNLVSSDDEGGLNIDLNLLPPAEDMETDAAYI